MTLIKLDTKLTPTDLLPKLERFWKRSAECIEAVEKSCPPGGPSPVFTVKGRYTSKGWTEWTQGFQYGAALLQFDATGDERFLKLGFERTLAVMTPHLTHVGVHDHGFNNVSTYGNLWRLMNEGRVPEHPWQRRYLELALKVSGAVQAARWATTSDRTGYIYSFNGPQSLFVDTIRSCRSLALAHQLGHTLMGEPEEKFSLLQRLVEHADNTARFNIWYGEGRDAYDVVGRTAHESIFNTNNGQYRCPSTQQGYSPFSTWTRGLAWAMLGYAELLEWLTILRDDQLEPLGGRDAISSVWLKAAQATCDFYIDETPTCGVPYWDTGAPGLAKLGSYRDWPADPFNDCEPVDSSAAAIAAQGLLRLGHYLVHEVGATDPGVRYVEAGLATIRTLIEEPYFSIDSKHEGLLLHSVYHRPNNWDYVPPGRTVPCGESSMWGDYHIREAALYVERLAENAPYYTFYGPVTSAEQIELANSFKRVALVTGGGRGIGRGIAEALADNGFDLAINGVRDATQVADALAALRQRGSVVHYCRGDVAVAADRQAIIDAVRSQFGRLDVVVNNAGVAPSVRADILDASEESFDRLIGINLKGPYFLTQLAARWMIEQRRTDEKFNGVIVNISSVNATEASINRGEYSISKAGLAMATQLWAYRLAEFGIAVYEVRPGIIHTGMSEAVAEKYDRLIANGLTVENRWGEPEDVGRAVAMLARGDLSYATGNVLRIDGGLTLRRL